jgi:hypothetical protein
MSIKKIQLTDTLLDTSAKKKTKKPRQKNTNHKTLRKAFFKKLKDRQHSHITPVQLNEETESFESEFDKSLSFLNALIVEKNKPKSISIASAATQPSQTTNQPSQTTKQPSQTEDIILPKYVASPTPYTSLKHTSRQTYREWKKTKLKPEVVSDTPILRIKRTTKTLKRKLGKTDKYVSVLIKNTTIKHKVQEETHRLRDTALHDIKLYLIQRNLLKAGSQCPNDILRKMYEQCILSGDINNQNVNIIKKYDLDDKRRK